MEKQFHKVNIHFFFQFQCKTDRLILLNLNNLFYIFITNKIDDSLMISISLIDIEWKNWSCVCVEILPCFCLSGVSQSLRSDALSDPGPDWKTNAETSVKHSLVNIQWPHLCEYVLPVEFLNGVSGGFPHIRWKVSGCFFDGQHHDGDDDGNSDTGQDPESARSDQLIGILHTHTNDEDVLS